MPNLTMFRVPQPGRLWMAGYVAGGSQEVYVRDARDERLPYRWQVLYRARDGRAVGARNYKTFGGMVQHLGDTFNAKAVHWLHREGW